MTADLKSDEIERMDGLICDKKISHVGDKVEPIWGEPFYSTILTPGELPIIAPESRPTPWTAYHRGSGEFDLFSKMKMDARQGNILPNYVGKVFCSNEEEKATFEIRLALLNGSGSIENPNDPSLPWRIIFCNANYGCDIFDTSGKILESYGSELDDVEALVAKIATHNEHALGDLDMRLKATANLNEVDRNQVIETEYKNLEHVLRYNNYDDKPTFFSGSESRRIAGFFRDAGRTDLADLINGVKMAKTLWLEIKAADINMDPHPIFKLRGLIHEDYFNLAEIEVEEVEFERISKQTYAIKSQRTIIYMRNSNEFEALSEESIVDFKERPPFYFSVCSLIGQLTKAGLQFKNCGLEPFEVEILKGNITKVDSIWHSKHANEMEQCNCLSYNPEYLALIL